MQTSAGTNLKIPNFRTHELQQYWTFGNQTLNLHKPPKNQTWTQNTPKRLNIRLGKRNVYKQFYYEGEFSQRKKCVHTLERSCLMYLFFPAGGNNSSSYFLSAFILLCSGWTVWWQQDRLEDSIVVLALRCFYLHNTYIFLIDSFGNWNNLFALKYYIHFIFVSCNLYFPN